MTGYIYSLNQQGSNEIFYIGKTINLKSRLNGHQTGVKNKIELQILEEIEFIDSKELDSCEKFWIEQCRQWGFPLQNHLHNIAFKNSHGPSFHVHLKRCPADLKELIDYYQAYAFYFDGKELTVEQTVYTMLYEWRELTKEAREERTKKLVQ